MTDIMNQEQRSKNMAAIKGRGNKTTEINFVKLLRNTKITGWRRHLKKLPGTPDFVFNKKKIAVFIDGDFWHGYNYLKLGIKLPNDFWKKKIENNMARDKRVNRELQKSGWVVLRFWEHQVINNPKTVIKKLLNEINKDIL